MLARHRSKERSGRLPCRATNCTLRRSACWQRHQPRLGFAPETLSGADTITPKRQACWPARRWLAVTAAEPAPFGGTDGASRQRLCGRCECVERTYSGHSSSRPVDTEVERHMLEPRRLAGRRGPCCPGHSREPGICKVELSVG